ncbi:nuclear transport factor 2 family protein [Mycoplasma marinum]|uniref:SnoaL-like domain-containing protein n=1 Tax=Mycoplasma marinum TaxID=1937190 RepID=A0A4R0XJL1_9MOLU|nr:nuclear transport factor 2 family protein [Mycoplasma marinum]TCG10813.1 hypothetical protein C4B24_03735 [Mycoplasma marinum]
MQNKKIIESFYDSWINKDINSLKKIYHHEVTFNDEAFRNLDWDKTISMWSMLFNRNKNPNLNCAYEIKEIKGDIVKTEIKLEYFFGKDKNPVTNCISTTFEIKDGKIINQLDAFDFKKWFNQAFNIQKSKSGLYYKTVQKLTRIKVKKDLAKFQRNSKTNK